MMGSKKLTRERFRTIARAQSPVQRAHAKLQVGRGAKLSRRLTADPAQHDQAGLSCLPHDAAGQCRFGKTHECVRHPVQVPASNVPLFWVPSSCS